MQTQWIFMKHIRQISALILLVAAFWPAVQPAFAADPVYPPGVRLGMTPLVGLVPATKFAGFQTDDEGVKVLVAELPAEAFGEVAGAFKANPGGTGGIKPETIETSAGLAYYTVEDAKDATGPVRRYSMILSGGTFSGYVAVQVPDNAAKIYNNEAIRKMFASAVIRKEVPVQEQLGLMPFNTTELSNFKNVRNIGSGAALVLADRDEGTGLETAPFMVIGLMAATPQSPEDRGRFAQQSATTIPGIRDARLTMSEPVRINGVAGFETRIDATSGKDNTPVTVVQWLRYGSNNTLRIIGSAPRDQWQSALTRFRAVRDGIQPR
jgi:hypothetical protein